MEPKLMYRGRDVDTLTREELIEALKVMVRLWEQELEHHKQSMELMEDLRKARA